MSDRESLTTLENFLELYNKETKEINEKEGLEQVDKVRYMLTSIALFMTFIIESQERPLTYKALLFDTIGRMIEENRAAKRGRNGNGS